MRTIKILSAIFIFSLAFQIHVSFSQILIGPKAGFNVGIFSVKNQVPDAKNSYRLGLIAGCIGELILNDILSVQMEPTYIQKGTKVSFFNGTFQEESKLRFAYVQIPLTLKARMSIETVNPVHIHRTQPWNFIVGERRIESKWLCARI